MLIKLKCDKFSEHISKEHTISFYKGLNVVCGDDEGSNAIGKSTFLLIIDFIFGGNSYTKLGKDIMVNVGMHTFYFEFLFGGESYFYSRSTDTPNQVAICTSKYEVINTITVGEYQDELARQYRIDCAPLRLTEISEHFFRIYIRDNTSARLPMRFKNEKFATSVDIILQLMKAYDESLALKNAEEHLGIKAGQDIKVKEKNYVAQIAENETKMASLQTRLDNLVANDPETQIKMLEGIDKQERSRMLEASTKLREISRVLDRIKAQIAAISSDRDMASKEYAEEFSALEQFFPHCNVKLFEDIEHFHKRINQMLQVRIQSEMKQLQNISAYYEKEFQRTKKKLHENELARKYSEQILRQCIAISREIDELNRKNNDLQTEKDRYDKIIDMRQKLEELYRAQAKRMKSVANDINRAMHDANEQVTAGTELPPHLTIEKDKEIFFATPNNTSEGTSFKNLVIYDLAMFRLTPIPILIHDSNILRNIDNVQLPRVLDAYMKIGKQVFIAFDRIESTPEETRKIIRDHQIVTLADGKELFGRSWSKTKTANRKK